MKTYREFLVEGVESTPRKAKKHLVIHGRHVYKGDIYYTNHEGFLHRLDGPALEKADGTKMWFVNGLQHRLDGPSTQDPDGLNLWYIEDEEVGPYGFTDEDKWLLLKANIENNIPILNEYGMTKEMQEYICQTRPDLTNQIWELDSELAKKYSHERELGQVDL